MGGIGAFEALFILLMWLVPIGAAIYVLALLSRITAAIEHLAAVADRISRTLERHFPEQP
ncbi:MAG: hypothetical protein HYY08_02770 [Firmicutes bacterium]|nr:hypothetical protein [Bacillota bacterium]